MTALDASSPQAFAVKNALTFQHWRDLAAGNKAKYDEWYKTQQ